MAKATKTPEQKAAEAFEKLKAKATELGVVFTDETTAEELAVNVDAAKEAAKPTKAKQTSFTVYKGGEPVRTYSVEQHGEDAEALANEFCTHSGDEVK